MAIDSVRIRGESDPNREEVVVEIAAVGGEGKLELSIVRGDVLEDAAVISVADLLTAIQVLRARLGGRRDAQVR